MGIGYSLDLIVVPSDRSSYHLLLSYLGRTRVEDTRDIFRFEGEFSSWMSGKYGVISKTGECLKEWMFS